MSKKSENKRLTILLPENIYDEFQRMTAEKYTTMSEVNRRLIIEWLAEQKAQGRPKAQGE